MPGIAGAPLGDGSIHQITLTYRGGAPVGLHQGKVQLHTDVPFQPVVQISAIYSVVGKPVEASAATAPPAPAGPG